jgi:ribosomal protein S12 methylthiotransferase accessory factor
VSNEIATPPQEDAVGKGASILKTFRLGTHRIASPSATVARVRPIFGPVGITRVANVTGLDCVGIPVVMVCRPNSRSLAVSQGKGINLDAARASGIMEAVELYHAERIVHPLKLATWNELRFTHPLVLVDTLPMISESAFHPELSLLWIQGIDLLASSIKWLPYELVHTNYTLPFPSGTGCFVMSSNGLASGNHALEAINHGLCEVIERDAGALFRLQSLEYQAERRVDLDSIDSSECRELLGLFAQAGVAVGVWDMTSDIGVAAFRVVILDREPSVFRPLAPVEGMGCHPARDVALSRALTEAAQARLTMIAGSRDDTGRQRFEQASDRELIHRARERLVERGQRSFELTPSFVNESLEADLERTLYQLKQADLTEAIVVDLTRPEFQIPVVRIVVPGLETYHHVQGYAPGARARRVIERSGWRALAR